MPRLFWRGTRSFCWRRCETALREASAEEACWRPGAFPRADYCAGGMAEPRDGVIDLKYPQRPVTMTHYSELDAHTFGDLDQIRRMSAR